MQMRKTKYNYYEHVSSDEESGIDDPDQLTSPDESNFKDNDEGDIDGEVAFNDEVFSGEGNENSSGYVYDAEAQSSAQRKNESKPDKKKKKRRGNFQDNDDDNNGEVYSHGGDEIRSGNIEDDEARKKRKREAKKERKREAEKKNKKSTKQNLELD